MSFEVFIQCVGRGQPFGVPRDAIKPLFPIIEDESELNYWSIRYDNVNSCTILVYPLVSDLTFVESLCVWHPCADLRLWDALLKVMQLGPIAMYFAGRAPPLVADAAIEDELPLEMIQVMGKPKVVRSAKEILEIIQEA